MVLPPWLHSSGAPAYRPVAGLENRGVRLSFLDRTLKAAAALLHGFVLSEGYVDQPGVLQGLDPRAKLLGLLFLILAASLIHSLPLLYGLYGLTLILALLSRIGFGFFLGRVWSVLLFFVGVIALPASLNLFTPGDPVWTLFTLERSYAWGPYTLPAEIALTRQGVLSALTLIGRVAASMSLVLLLVLTTPWSSLLKALRAFRVPQIYVQTLAMALRYLLLLCRIVQERASAKKSRTIRRGRTRTEQRWVAGQLGALFKWSLQMSIGVHQAMVARGYQGEVRILSSFRARGRDYLWTACCAALTGLLVYYGR